MPLQSLFRADGPPGAHPVPDIAELLARLAADDAGEPERTLNCRYCRQPITRAKDRIEIDARHEHRVVNPHGFRFRLGCFGDAPGTVASGRPTARWSWFAGYRWQISSCGGCAVHLGWRFSGSDTNADFYGLILDRLIEQKTE